MGTWLEHLMPWYDKEAQMKRERKTAVIEKVAKREISRTDKVIESYREAAALLAERH